ncbi:hypothetical protein T552_00942 [Pneumocystis carinii B80]|uniref:Long chronological lifespan protein 2 n=1 Tax=Pneumocystis carinii (strain B80) TaxID=1408658 RepID=A0A0W4ZMY0_PNEC8|nr:hypothetical protein T552_00942 [Pneumocystis carinii B80]KTW29735.1 hypothetical protein T552_00942 [Pneumocystis carinii B80]
MKPRDLIIYIFVFGGVVLGYFHIFDKFFQKNQKEDQELFGQDWLRKKFQSVSCSDQQYLCSDTLQCVNHPANCPCPFPTSQVRCSLGNGGYICVSLSEEHDPCQIIEQYRLGNNI